MASHLLSSFFTTVIIMASSFFSTSPFFPRRPTSTKNPPECLTGFCATAGNRKLGKGSPVPAMANPIPAPNLTACSRDAERDTFTGERINFNCCPPLSHSPARDFRMPTVSKLRVRPALHLASDKYMEKFQRAIQAMKDLSAKDPDDPRGFTQQSNIHCAYCNFAFPKSPGSDERLQIHANWLFLAWHRWYLYFFERICAHLINDDSFAIPFWNWDNPAAMEMPEFFTREITRLYNPNPLYNNNRDKSHYPHENLDLLFDGTPNPNPPDTIVANNLSEMYLEMVQNAKTLESFYGGEYYVGSSGPQMLGSIESMSHGSVHWWVGQSWRNGYDMGNFATSGHDTLFHTHHNNIDRLWKVWRDGRDKQGKPKDIDDPNWLNAKFVFYDENKDLWEVSVAQCLDNERLGFTWQDVDNPWQTAKPKALVKRSTFAQASKAPKHSDTMFPVRLDKVLTVKVDRPKKSRSVNEKAKEEELLEISGIDIDRSKFVRFEVFVNDEGVEHNQLISTAEYAGSYSHVPLLKPGRTMSKFRLALSELLEELDIEEHKEIVVSIVPKAGGEHVNIGGVKVVFASRH